MVFEDDEPRYKKKSKKITPKKIKHKHEYSPCVFEYEVKGFDKRYGQVPVPKTGIGTYCLRCGRIGGVSSYEWSVWIQENAFSHIGRFEYTDEAKKELNKDTRTLPTFHLDDAYAQKYVLIE